MKDFILESSANPEKLSLSVRGVLITLIPLAMVAVRFYGIDNLDETTLTGLIDAIAKSVEYLGFFAGSVMTAWGLVRKVLVQIGSAIEK